MNAPLLKYPEDCVGPHGVKLDEVIRVKTYIKPDFSGTPEFEQPMKVAADRLGRPWKECNRVATCELAGCNLDCWYCYLPPSMQTVSLEPVEVAVRFREVCGADFDPCVWRISGGEPLLHADFVLALLRTFDFLDRLEEDGPNMYRWLNTNLTIEPSAALLHYLSAARDRAGVVGCFKGLHGMALQQNQSAFSRLSDFESGALFEKSIQNARLYIERDVDVFFRVVPLVTDPIPDDGVKRLADFIDRIRVDVDANAPLRMRPVHVKVYPWTEEKAPPYVDLASYWDAAMDRFYTPFDRWPPSHQVEFAGRLGE